MKPHDNGLSRRKLIGAAAATAAAVGSLGAENNKKQFKIKNGKIRQSVMGWCFNPMPTMDLAKHCKEIGLVAMEGIDADYPAVRELGLKFRLLAEDMALEMVRVILRIQKQLSTA